jgi:FkbM family methyltransferase
MVVESSSKETTHKKMKVGDLLFKVIDYLRNIYLEAKAFKSPLSLFTLLVAPLFFKALARLGFPVPKYFIANCPDGSKILYPVFSDVGIRGNLLDLYGNAEYFHLNSHKPKKDDVVVDCGAYVGLYSIISSKLCGNNGMVISIEPEPKTFNLLKKNLELNNIRNVSTYNFALSECDGNVEFYVPRISAAGSTFNLPHLNAQKIEYYDKILVKTVTFDNFIKKLNLTHVDIMKIDVEGSELLVLRGAYRSLERGMIDKLIVEVHKTVTDIGKIKKFLCMVGYTIDFYIVINKFKGMLYAHHSRKKEN